jgi:CheY-like chemotaxis protein
MPIAVIVVDDERFDRLSARRRLSKFEAFGEVMEFDDGDTFLDHCYGNQPPGVIPASATCPALILIDINMRRMNGFETLEELQRRIGRRLGQRHVRAVMLTSSANEVDKQRAAAIPIVSAFLTKPLSNDGVARILELYEPIVAD